MKKFADTWDILHGKAWFVCFFMFFAQYGHSEVVVVAAGSNRSIDPKTKPLEFASRDASSFADTMIKVGAVPSAMVKLAKNPRLSEFEETLKNSLQLLKTSANQTSNKFIFFFSGHADERGLHFRDGFFSKESLDRFVAKLPAKTKVLIIDSCFAGLLSNKGIKSTTGFGSPKLNFDEPSGSIYLTASSGSDFAYESQKLGGGIFSTNIVNGLRGKADSNGDGVVTATELYEYAFRETRLTSRIISIPGEQSPEFVANLQGRGAVALTFPMMAQGSVRMSSDIHGKVKLYAAKGIKDFEHMKVGGSDDTILLPTGDYQVEVVDGPRRGIGDVRVASTSTALLTKDDIVWNSGVDASMVRTRGIAAEKRSDAMKDSQRLISVSAGTAGGFSRSDFEASIATENRNGWLWPILSVGYGRTIEAATSRSTDEMHTASEENTNVNASKINSSHGLMLGLGVPLWSNQTKSIAIHNLVSAGGRFVSLSGVHSEVASRVEISSVVRDEVRVSLFTGRLFLSVGGEKYFSASIVDRDLQLITSKMGYVFIL